MKIVDPVLVPTKKSLRQVIKRRIPYSWLTSDSRIIDDRIFPRSAITKKDIIEVLEGNNPKDRIPLLRLRNIEAVHCIDPLDKDDQKKFFRCFTVEGKLIRVPLYQRKNVRKWLDKTLYQNRLPSKSSLKITMEGSVSMTLPHNARLLKSLNQAKKFVANMVSFSRKNHIPLFQVYLNALESDPLDVYIYGKKYRSDNPSWEGNQNPIQFCVESGHIILVSNGTEGDSFRY